MANQAAAPAGAATVGAVAAELVDVRVTYPSPSGEVEALRGVSHRFGKGTTTAIVGRSGSGKSSLISVLSLLRTPTSGEVLLAGRAVTSLSQSEIARIRGQEVAVVFQSFHLDPLSSAASNVMLPWVFQGIGSRRQARARAKEVLDQLGIAQLADSRPNQMSGGQRQRVAIARALFPRPALLIADEPTGNLDEETANKVAQDIFSLSTVFDTTVVVVTHDRDIAAMAGRTLDLRQGRIGED